MEESVVLVRNLHQDPGGSREISVLRKGQERTVAAVGLRQDLEVRTRNAKSTADYGVEFHLLSSITLVHDFVLSQQCL